MTRRPRLRVLVGLGLLWLVYCYALSYLLLSAHLNATT